MTHEPSFSKEDVWAMARAILDFPVSEDRDCRMVCSYCGVRAHWQDDPFPHALDCVTRIAEDVLTGCVPSENNL